MLFFDCLIPVSLRFRCVLQSSILKPFGSPDPGANECLIRIIFSPLIAGFHLSIEEFVWLKIRKKKMLQPNIGDLWLKFFHKTQL